MHAIHLNYHEVTKDPRVLKECESLAQSGVEITVVCAQLENASPTEQFGDLKIRRIDWQRSDQLKRADLNRWTAFRRSMPHIRKRFARIPTMNAVRRVMAKYSVRGASKPGQPRLAPTPALPRLAGILSKITRTASGERSLYQAAAFLFDHNMRNLSFEAPVHLVHAHDIYTLPAGVMLSQRLRVPLVYDAHEFEIERASKMPLEGNAMVDAIERDCLEHVDALITVSEGLKKLYAKRYARREPVVVFNAPVITIDDYPEPDPDRRREFRAALGVDDATPLIAYTGHVLKEQRGLDRVVEALAFLPAYHLVVLGQRHQRNDAHLLDVAAEGGVVDRVHLLAPVHHSLVAPTIRSCDVAVVPFQDATLSYRHAMPNKLFEAIFSGLPVCVSNLPDMREFVDLLGRGRSMDQTSPKDIATTLAYLYDHRDDYRMDREAWARLVRGHSWSAQVEKLSALYHNLVPPAQLHARHA